MSLYAGILEVAKEALVRTTKLVKYDNDDVDAATGSLPKKYSRIHRNLSSKTLLRSMNVLGN